MTKTLRDRVLSEIGTCKHCSRPMDLNKSHKICDSCGVEVPKMSESLYRELISHARYNVVLECRPDWVDLKFAFGIPIFGVRDGS